MLPLALYIHFPWCVKKCPYCDFNSHALGAGDDALITAWVEAVIADLDAALPGIPDRPIESIFIGGGTPSLIPATALLHLMTAVHARLKFVPEVEITLEANPGTVDSACFGAFRDAGINRLSLGVQSFNNRQLKAIGRIHDADDARRTIEAARMAFKRVNLDLMYGLPGQTLAEAREDVDTALAFGTEHLSAYHLTIEPNTPFAHSSPERPDDELVADMEDMIEARLADAGYEHYEISAHARPGGRCRHNLNYWGFGDYLGIGPGAHGKLTTLEGIIREIRHKHPARYLAGVRSGSFVQTRHRVEDRDLPVEFMMNALRLAEGVPATWFTRRTGLSLAVIQPALAAAIAAGLLDPDPSVLRPTPCGQRFLNDLIGYFFHLPSTSASSS